MCRFWPVYPDTNPARAKAHEIAAAFTEKYGVKHMDVYEIFEGRGDYNLCTLSKSFQPAGFTKRPLFMIMRVLKRGSAELSSV